MDTILLVNSILAVILSLAFFGFILYLIFYAVTRGVQLSKILTSGQEIARATCVIAGDSAQGSLTFTVENADAWHRVLAPLVYLEKYRGRSLINQMKTLPYTLELYDAHRRLLHTNDGHLSEPIRSYISGRQSTGTRAESRRGIHRERSQYMGHAILLDFFPPQPGEYTVVLLSTAEQQISTPEDQLACKLTALEMQVRAAVSLFPPSKTPPYPVVDLRKTG